jgi:dTDP-glucose 4,6-dehydratase
MSRHVLITGGCGFAGSHLVEHLLAVTDWRLTVLDSLTYAGRADRLVESAHFAQHRDRVRLVWADLRGDFVRDLAGPFGDPSVILHLAAHTHVDRSIDDPAPFVLDNVTGTVNLLGYARALDDAGALSHFVQVSTDEVYGPAAAGYAHREGEPHRPSNPYAASKAACEDIASAYWRTYGLPLVISNTMNMIGERQHPEKFLPKTVRAVLGDEPVTAHARQRGDIGGWEPSARCWLHARNHADALRWIVEETVPALYGEEDEPDRWNVVGEERDVAEMIDAVGLILGRAPRVDYVDYHGSRPGHDHRYALDGTKLAAAGWKPPVGFDDALDRTVRWFAEHPSWLR